MIEVFASIASCAGVIIHPRFRGGRRLLVLFLAVFANLLVPVVRGQEVAVQMDADQTKIEFALSDVLHTVHGSFRLKTGTIRFDPATGKASGSIVVDATSGDSGNGSRDRKMHREILESGKFQEIIFTPSQVKGTLARENSSRLEISGQFQMHGQSHELSLPVDVQVSGQQLKLATQFTVPYVLWGLKNPSTFLLRVSDKVTIDIHAVGNFANAETGVR